MHTHVTRSLHYSFIVDRLRPGNIHWLPSLPNHKTYVVFEINALAQHLKNCVSVECFAATYGAKYEAERLNASIPHAYFVHRLRHFNPPTVARACTHTPRTRAPGEQVDTFITDSITATPQPTQVIAVRRHCRTLQPRVNCIAIWA